VFRGAVSEVGLELDLLEDCILMASELAASTLHAHAVAGTGGGGDRFVSVAPDMGGEPISSAGPGPGPAYPAGHRRGSRRRRGLPAQTVIPPATRA